MSVMKLVPVFKCRYHGCGKPLYVSLLATAMPDESGEKLQQMMRGLEKIALCPFHQAKRNWYAQQGRSEEFEQMAAGKAILLAVHDPGKG